VAKGPARGYLVSGCFAIGLLRFIKSTTTIWPALGKTFKDFDDKDWSFTDCTSKVVIEQRRISQAFAFDHHFNQFGTVQVVPTD
jgi:predicted nucleic acid-binding protein